MMGRNEFNDVLYLIDFGLSKKYIDPKTGEHVKFKNNHRLNGTARFASIHALEGYELSRRDDLESLCYVLVYLLKGNLPWTRIKNKNKYEKYKVILNMKKKMSEDILIGDKNNSEFIDFLKYCRNLKFEEAPDYNYLRGLMTKCISKNNKINDIMGSKNDIFEHSLIIDTSLNKIYKNKKRTCSVKRVKINLVSNKLLNANKRNEITDLDNKIINETK
jgi:serine/threonine protein kinase